MGRIFSRGASVLATGAVLGLSLQILPAQEARAAPAAASGWRLADVLGSGAANIYPAMPINTDIAAPGRDSAWSIWGGCTWPCRGNPHPVVQRWNGRRWAPIPSRDLHGLSAMAVTASSARDAWLFGSFPDAKAPRGTIEAALHWNGTAWSRRTVPGWLIKADGSGNTAFYPEDFGRRGMWAFSMGGYLGEKAAFAGHYHNGRWTKVRLPYIPDSDVAAVSASNIWMLGQSQPTLPSRLVLMHWNGRRWSATGLPSQPAAGNPAGVFAAGPRDLWLPWWPTKASAQEYLLHWTGGRWSKVRLPNGDNGGPVTTDGAGGWRGTGFAGGRKRVQLFLHWRAGRWTITRVPNGHYQPGNVDELVRIAGTRSVWAIGNVYGRGGGTVLNRGAIWRYIP